MSKRGRDSAFKFVPTRGFVLRNADWDYIYELVCDPSLNLMDQIRYSEQIAQLREEMNQFSDWRDQLPESIPTKFLGSDQ